MMAHPRGEDIPALKQIWKAAFGDPDSYIDFFFEHRFSVQKAMVAYEKDKPVSVLYVLPCHINVDGEQHPAGYIYAAATHPKKQSKGWMGNLLHYAKSIAKEEDLAALVLRPGEPSLTRYYERHGYRTFFQESTAKFTRKQLLSCAKAGSQILPAFADVVTAFRRHYLDGWEGSIQWEEDAVEYALEENTFTGGKNIFIRCPQGVGYALVGPGPHVTVKEWMAERGVFAYLADAILKQSEGETFTMRSPAGILRQEISKMSPGGMILPVSSPCIWRGKPPYLGLTLD
ncbi:GNAT family N-acetyltransferase [Solibaculum mannosilyticum]|uniref:GNAT family N-acetyltransferase n=1 Tax=Solibaculum mannosilyticum TaxID=2780922 RepID=UPI0007A88DC7|nr:hypothetical protein BN3661_00839 [Eubacteriaceae bacterium CHKCI005]